MELRRPKFIVNENWVRLQQTNRLARFLDGFQIDEIRGQLHRREGIPGDAVFDQTPHSQLHVELSHCVPDVKAQKRRCHHAGADRHDPYRRGYAVNLL